MTPRLVAALAVAFALALVLVQLSQSQGDLQPAAYLPHVVRHGPAPGAFNPYAYIGQGDRYTIWVGGQQSYLFFERSAKASGNNIGRWFVERRTA